MQIGLFFGSFNPIHIGHLALANYIVENSALQQIWFVVSPQNPFKRKENLLADYHRLELVNQAIENDDRFRASNIEFNLPKPSYTATTLAYLKEKYPQHEFAIIMGEDNLRTLHKWHNYEQILKNHTLYVYPRLLTMQEEHEVGTINSHISNDFSKEGNVIICDEAPVMKVSASFVRQAIKDGKDVRYLLTEPVHRYINEMNFYKK